MIEPIPCPVCGEPPEVSQLCVSLWVVMHEVNDDHLIRVTGKTHDEAVAKWNLMDKSSELPGWLVEKIQELKNKAEDLHYSDWEYAKYSNSEQFSIVKMEIEFYLLQVLAMKGENHD